MSKSNIPLVVLVGRTNVGKSTLFNRLLEQPKALVSKVAGTTRDRNEGDCLWRGKIIRVCDTGGLDINHEDEIERNIMKQAHLAIKKADLILFVTDAKAGPLPQEQQLARMLSQSKKQVIVVANKAERAQERIAIEDREWKLANLPTPIGVSALRGSGIGDLLDVVYEKLIATGKPPVEAPEIHAIRVSVIGKPNVGKSTLLNAIMGEERFITSPIAHTTREPNDTLVVADDKQYVFIDTAGMRKKAKVRRAGGLEQAAVERNKLIIQSSDVTLLVLDVNEPLGTQERVLAGLLKGSGCGVIVVANKWDLIPGKNTVTMNRFREYIAGTFPFLKWAPVMFVSAITNQRVHDLFKMIDDVNAHREMMLTKKQLEEFLTDATTTLAPRRGKGTKPPKILGFKQTSARPPTFDLIIKAMREDNLATSYITYLQNSLRNKFGLTGTPVRINVRIATSVAK